MVWRHPIMQLHLGLHWLDVEANEHTKAKGAVAVESFFNGMRASALSSVTWTKSSHSNATGNCVELAELPGGRVAVRNSRDPQGPVLIYTRDEIAAFVAGARGGDFDYVIG